MRKVQLPSRSSALCKLLQPLTGATANIHVDCRYTYVSRLVFLNEWLQRSVWKAPIRPCVNMKASAVCQLDALQISVPNSVVSQWLCSCGTRIVSKVWFVICRSKDISRLKTSKLGSNMNQSHRLHLSTKEWRSITDGFKWIVLNSWIVFRSLKREEATFREMSDDMSFLVNLVSFLDYGCLGTGLGHMYNHCSVQCLVRTCFTLEELTVKW